MKHRPNSSSVKGSLPDRLKLTNFGGEPLGFSILAKRALSGGAGPYLVISFKVSNCSSISDHRLDRATF